MRSKLGNFYDHKSVGDIRSLGLVAAVEIVKDRQTKEQIGDVPMESTHRLEELTWEKGVFARAMLENIAIAPPFTITKEDMDIVIDSLDSSIEQMEKEML